MRNVPVKNGKKCVFRVIRVCGTIRKAEEAAVRRAKEMIVRARRELGDQSDSMLDDMFEKDGQSRMDSTKDVLMVDGSDSDEDEEMSDGQG